MAAQERQDMTAIQSGQPVEMKNRGGTCPAPQDADRGHLVGIPHLKPMPYQGFRQKALVVVLIIWKKGNLQ